LDSVDFNLIQKVWVRVKMFNTNALAYYLLRAKNYKAKRLYMIGHNKNWKKKKNVIRPSTSDQSYKILFSVISIFDQ
jgi:hypothetical protein